MDPHYLTSVGMAIRATSYYKEIYLTQVVNVRPPPAPYDTDIHMDDLDDIDAISPSLPAP